MSSLPDTIAEAASGLREGRYSSVGITQAFLGRADVLDSRLGTYLARFDEQALQTAEQLDAELTTGQDRGPLHGIPLAIKDNIATNERRPTAQSTVSADGWNYEGDAPTVSRLRAAGAVILGKTTMGEFALGLPDTTKPFPIPRNPWDEALWAGGSSSGTANGVSAGLFLGGLGSDTGGSIRVPSAYCGVTGLKPTFGLVPKSGCIPLGYSLDVIGPIARTARDCAMLLDAIAGYERSDPDSAHSESVFDPSSDVLDVSGLRLGVDRNIQADCTPETAAALEDALAVLAGAGLSIVDTTLPYYEEAKSATWVVLLSEALAFHRSKLRTNWNDYAATSRNALATGIFYTGADYVQAQRVRRATQDKARRMMSGIDLLVTPTVSGGAQPPDADMGVISATLHTFYFNAVGFPAISMPMGFTQSGLPLSVQLAGEPFREATLLGVAERYQQLTKWQDARPPVY